MHEYRESSYATLTDLPQVAFVAVMNHKEGRHDIAGNHVYCVSIILNS